MDTMDVYYSRCRLCAGVYTLGINIFGEEGTKMDVKQKINTYLSLEVEVGDALPKNICYLCLGRIEEFHKFKTMCSETQLTLKNWTHCLDDEDMPFCSEYICTSELEDREENEILCTSLSSRSSSAAATSVENPNGKHPEESSSGRKFSTKKRRKMSNGTSKKVKSKRHGRRTEKNSSETLATKGSSETYINVNGLCSSTFSKHNSAPSRRKNGSHIKNKTQQIVQLEEFTTSDDEEQEVGFPGFIAERHTSAAEVAYKREMDSGSSPENKTAAKSPREREQNEFNDPDYLLNNTDRAQFGETNNEAEMLSGVKQEPDEETYTQYKCNVCHHIFTRNTTLKEHLKVHSGKDSYTCPSCTKPFRNNYKLILHMNTHKNDGYKCADCNMEFSQKETFIEHTRIHHIAKQQSSKNCNTQLLQKTTIMNNERHKKKTYCCKYCKANFQDKSSCTGHMRCHFGEKPYACNLCDRRFTQQANLMSHLKVHGNESFTCWLCKSSFSSKAQLTEHLSLAHRDVILEVVNDAKPENSNL